MKEVHPGDLREQVDIVRETAIINENGYPEPLREVVCSKLWAAVDDDADQQSRAGDAQLVQDVVRFVIRQRSGIEMGMIVLYLDVRREIIGVEHIGARREYLMLKTKASRAVGG